MKSKEDVVEVFDEGFRYACFNGHDEIVELLIGYGADPNEANGLALRSAWSNGHIKVVKVLSKYWDFSNVCTDTKLLQQINKFQKDIKDI